MIVRNLHQDDDLGDFEHRELTFEEATKTVHVAGDGPAVIVMAEMPGISPHVARFARWVRDAGFSVYMPSLFGRDGAVAEAVAGASVWQKVCISAEFRVFGSGESSPVTSWLMALARFAHSERGGRGVGAIGMCLTGNFALTMLLEPAVIASVMSQPALPMDEPGGLEISSDELKTIRDRLEDEDLEVLAYRFEGDPVCRAERFAAYAEALGSRFIGRAIPDGAGKQDDLPSFSSEYVHQPHSVVTVNLIDEQGQPTARARDEIIHFFRHCLLEA